MTVQRVLYINRGGITIYELAGREIAVAANFCNSDTGYDAFRKHMARDIEKSCHIIVDIIDEEYQHTTIPHVFGSERYKILKRNLERSYRSTPYRYGEIQGREVEGRRDDKVFFAAIVNYEFMVPWLSALNEKRVSLQGISSVPLVTRSLIPFLERPGKYLLIVSQTSGGLRFSYFEGRQLKISRLTPLDEADVERCADIIVREVGRTQGYLGRLRLMPPEDKVLEVHVVCQEDLLLELAMRVGTVERPVYRLFDTNVFMVNQQLHWEDDESGNQDPLFAYLVLTNHVPNYYASQTERRLYTLRASRRWIFAGGIAATAGAVAVSSTLLINTHLTEKKVGEMDRKIVIERRLLSQTQARLPPLPVDAEVLRDAVQAVDELRSRQREPQQLIVQISRLLDSFGDLQVDRFSWRFEERQMDVAVTEAGGQSDDPTEMPDIPDEGEEGFYAWVNVATIEGQVSPFDGDYRRANRAVRNFVAAIERMAMFQAVTLLDAPVNEAPDAIVSGTVGGRGGQQHRAGFVIEAVLRVD